MTLAEASDKFLPICAIFPFFINTSVLERTPSFSFVQTVAFLINKFSWCGNESHPYAPNGYVTLPSFNGVFFFALSADSVTLTSVAVHVNGLPEVSTPLPCHTSPLFTPLKRILAPPWPALPLFPCSG